MNASDPSPPAPPGLLLAPKTPPPGAAARARILVVEDEAIVARDIRQQLTDLGYEAVADCATGEEAVALAERLRPALVLMDIQLAGAMDGVHAAQLIRERLHLPVVFLTAFASDPMLARAKRAEPFGCVIKPFDERELRTVIEMALYKHAAETQLHAQEQKLRMIIEHSTQLFYSHGPDGVITYMSPQAREYLDCEPEETLVHWTNFITDHPQNAVGRELTDRAIATGQPQPTYQLEVRTKRGRTLWVEVRESPVVENGRTVAIVGALTDITASRQNREALHLQSAALAATANSVVITNAQGDIEWVNPAFTRTSGYTAAEVIGRKSSLLKSGQQPQEYYAAMWRTITAGRSWAGEFVNLRKDGGLFTEEVTITPVQDASGTITHFVAVKQDITERKSLESQLRQTQRMESIGLLASGIAHDLNNVLAPIALATALLRAQYPAPDAAKKIAMIEQSCQRGADIIRQVLTFARGAEGRRDTLQVGRLVKEMVRLIAETFPRNIEVGYELTAIHHSISADPTQIHQVLLNLAVNARDAMPAGGRLVFELTNRELGEADLREHPGVAPGSFLVISVRDTGTGIPPEVVPQVFEPFFTTKPRGHGTGLGLSTVHGIVRSHGGFVRVRSQLGLGTTFEVFLPALPAPADAPTRSRSSSPFAGGHGEWILFADDEPNIREVTQLVLQSHGYTPLAAATGEQALELFRTHAAQIRFVLLDRMMPGRNGEEIAREIHRLDPRMPIVLSTGLLQHGQAPADEENFASPDTGIRAILHKPYSEAKLLRAIRAALSG